MEKEIKLSGDYPKFKEITTDQIIDAIKDTSNYKNFKKMYGEAIAEKCFITNVNIEALRDELNESIKKRLFGDNKNS